MSHSYVLQQIKENLAKNLPQGGSAILFGSRARGDEHAESDWDVLILLDKERLETADYDNVAFPLRMLGWELEEDISPILYTKSEWASNHITPFYHNVINDGIRLV